MTETLTFPGLGLSFELGRVAFWIGSFPVYWYGIAFAAAFLLGLTYFHFSARRVGIHPYEGLDALLWAIVGGVVGARVYFVIFQWEAMYKANPMKVFAFREGGLAIYGGVIGAILVGIFACRLKKLPVLPMLDVGMPALLLGQAIGRWGNFFNIEAFGGNTDLPWGMTSKSIENFLSRPDVVNELAKLGQTANPFVPVHPTFFYEFAWNLVGFLLLAFVLTPRRRYDGQVALGYMAWYGLGRAFIEGLRTDSLVAQTPWGMIRVSQYLAIAGFIASIILMVVLSRKARSDSRPAWMGLFAGSEASAELLRRGDEAIAAEKSGKKKSDTADSTVAEAAEAPLETESLDIDTVGEPDNETAVIVYTDDEADVSSAAEDAEPTQTEVEPADDTDR